MKLEVGMYVRTKFGVIDKCINTVVDYSKELIQCETREISKHQITKVSENIIGILEVGDYVNGVLVENIYSREEDKIYFHTFGEEIMIEVAKENLNNIVTKEQFESMEYKVGE